MPLLLLCLGTILSSCPASCQPSYSPPPSPGSVAAAWSHLSTRSTMALSRSAPMAPAPSPSESGPEMRSSPSAASGPAQQRLPSLAACVAAADCRVRAQAALLQPSGSSFQTCWFLCLPLRRRCKTVPEPFSYPVRRFLHAQTGSAFTASTDEVPVPSTGTAKEVGPLTSSPSSQGQSSGGNLWRAAYAPGDGQTSLAYPSNPVQYLYINCYVTANKPVLSYLLLHLLTQHFCFENSQQQYL
jgi:hypothetical protein